MTSPRSVRRFGRWAAPGSPDLSGARRWSRVERVRVPFTEHEQETRPITPDWPDDRTIGAWSGRQFAAAPANPRGEYSVAYRLRRTDPKRPPPSVMPHTELSQRRGLAATTSYSMGLSGCRGLPGILEFSASGRMDWRVIPGPRPVAGDST